MFIIKEYDRVYARSTALLTRKNLAQIKTVLDSSETFIEAEKKRMTKKGHCTFSLVQLFMVYLLYETKKTTLKGVIKELSSKICQVLDLPKVNGRYRKPSYNHLCDFKNYILPTFFDDFSKEYIVSMINNEKVLGHELLITIDSTPAEASRYNCSAIYNLHYSIRLDKSPNITVCGTTLDMIPSDGLDHDCNYLLPLISRLSTLPLGDLSTSKVMMDGGYDTKECFYECYKHTCTIPMINFRENAVYNPDASWENIQRKYSKMYKLERYDAYKKNDERYVLSFLYNHGKSDLVGSYLRNLELIRYSE